mgnify:CR=1 FL=1
MNRIIILSILLFISCTKTTENLSKESNQTNSTQPSSTPSPPNNIDNNSRVIDNHIHKKETRYYHSGGSGSVIISQDGSRKVKWKKKCNFCGNLENTTHNSSRSSGSLRTTYRCNKCKKMSDVIITTTSSRY